jgi:hypothetical protein
VVLKVCILLLKIRNVVKRGNGSLYIGIFMVMYGDLMV